MRLLEVFNNRELATILWAIVFLIWAAIKPNILHSIGNLFNAVMRMWIIFLIMIAYVVLSVLVLRELSLWDMSLLKVTIFWFFGWAIVVLMNSNKVGVEKNYLKNTLTGMVGLTVLVSFIADFYTFPFFIEIFLVPFAVFITMLATYSGMKDTYRSIHMFLSWIMITFGILILGINLYRAISNFKDFATIGTLQEFLLPILLSIMFLPFIYLLVVCMKYQSQKVMDKFTKEKILTNLAK